MVAIKASAMKGTANFSRSFNEPSLKCAIRSMERGPDANHREVARNGLLDGMTGQPS
jgi:hypothetical protein